MANDLAPRCEFFIYLFISILLLHPLLDKQSYVGALHVYIMLYPPLSALG